MLLTNASRLLEVYFHISDLAKFEIDTTFASELLSPSEKRFLMDAVRALANDILSVSEDFKTSINFYIRQSGCLIEMDSSYPFLIQSSFNFELYEPLIKHKSLDQYVNDLIYQNDRYRTYGSYLTLVDFRSFFENIRFIDNLFEFDGKFYSFYQDIDFTLGAREVKFDSFNSFVHCGENPLLKIQFGDLLVTISPDEFSFAIMGGSAILTISKQSRRSYQQKKDNLATLIIDMYNMELMTEADTMKNLLLLIRMKAI
jgi:hypothetical protein